MNPMLRSLIVVAVLSLCVSKAAARDVVRVPAGVVTLGQVWPEAPAHAASVELGSAPPVGGSRLVLRRELEQRLRAAGVDVTKLRLPEARRIVTESERWTADRVRETAGVSAEATLPEGVSLKRVNVHSGLLLPRGAEAAGIELPKIPRRAGEATLAAVLLLEYQSSIVRRVPVTLIVDVSEAAAQPLIVRGATLKVYIDRRSAKITAVAQALQDGDLGETIQFRIQATQRVVRARVESPYSAQVVTR